MDSRELDQWAPEDLVGGVAVIHEEVGSSCDELFLWEEAIFVGVYGVEAGGGHGVIETKHFEEDSVLIATDHVVLVGVYSTEEQRQGSLDDGFAVGVLYLGLHGGDECVLVNALSTGYGRQEFVPNLKVKEDTLDLLFW